MKIDITPKRREAIKELTHLMQSQRPFSYLRLGDGELRWLLEMQEGKDPKKWTYFTNQGASVNAAFGVNGLKPEHYKRLLDAYEHCHFIDLYETVPYNQKNLSSLKLNLSSKTRRAKGKASHLIFEWTYLEFADYVSSHKCLFACSESPLLEQLYQDSRYRQLSSEFWRDESKPIFLRIRENGRYYWNFIDEIKEDIQKEVIKHQVDTVFISLGTGAKILCYELAEDLGICTFDLGSVSRALSYAGSPGYHSVRDSHSPFLFRIPLPIYMEAVEKAYPEMSPADIVTKAHSQLCLELQRKIIGSSTASDVYDASSFDPDYSNLQNFWESYRYYREKYIPLAKEDSQVRELVRDFTRYRLVHGLGIDGYIFKLLVNVKGKLRSTLGLKF